MKCLIYNNIITSRETQPRLFCKVATHSSRISQSTKLVSFLVNDLFDTLNLLRRHGYDGVNFDEFDLFLGLLHATLSVIEANHRGDVNRCLKECLVAWLEQADDVQVRGGPILHSLLAALRKLGKKQQLME